MNAKCEVKIFGTEFRAEQKITLFCDDNKKTGSFPTYRTVHGCWTLDLAGHGYDIPTGSLVTQTTKLDVLCP